MPLRDRNVLLLAAGYAPAYQETRFDDPRLGPVRTDLERILAGHQPYPAVIVDRRSDLVTANDAFWRLTQDAAPALLAPPVNVAPAAAAPHGMVTVAELRLEAFLPADDATATALNDLARHPA